MAALLDMDLVAEEHWPKKVRRSTFGAKLFWQALEMGEVSKLVHYEWTIAILYCYPSTCH